MPKRILTPEQKERKKFYAQNYKARRRVVARALHQKKKNDPEYIAQCRQRVKSSYKKSASLLNDSYIKKILRLWKDATPEIIEEKRKQILEFRQFIADRKLKKELLIKKQKELEDFRRLHGIVKVCKIHGDLKEDETFLTSNGKKAINKIRICKTCKNLKSKESFRKNYEKRIKQAKIYAKKNQEYILAYRKKWLQTLPDSYVMRYFKKYNIFEVDQELLELKKALMRLKRKIRAVKKKETEK